MTANPLDAIEDQEDQEDLVVEVEEEDAPAEEPAAPEPEPKAPRPPVEPAPAPEAKPAAEDDDDDASLSEKVRKRINKMTYKQRKAEREANEYRQQLEALRQEREAERRQYEARVGQSDDLIIASREEAIKAEIARANQDYISAYRSGEEDGLIKANAKMVELQVAQQELLRVKQRRDAERDARHRAEPQPQTAPQAPYAGTSQQPAGDDWVQLRAKANQLTEDFIANNSTWFDRNTAMTSAAIGIDKELQAEGRLKPWEPSFYEEVERRMRAEFPHKFGAAEPAASVSAPAARPSQPVAGVSRGTAKGSTPVRLSPEDKAYCDRNGLSYTIFGKEKLALERGNK